jgi:hypothetical protein
MTYVITSGTTINTTGATSGVFTGLLAGSYVFIATLMQTDVPEPDLLQ